MGARIACDERAASEALHCARAAIDRARHAGACQLRMELQCSKLQPGRESRLLLPDFDPFGADVCGRGYSGGVADRAAVRQFEFHPDSAAAYGATGGRVSGAADCGTG